MTTSSPRKLLSLVLLFVVLPACGSEPTDTNDTSAGGATTTTHSTGGSGGGGGDGGGGGGGGTTSSTGGTTFLTTTSIEEPTPLAGGETDTAWSVALGPEDVYWANMAIPGEGQYHSGIKKVPKASGQETFEMDGPWVMAIALDSTHLYWADGVAILRKPLGGDTVTKVAENQPVEAGAAIAVDSTSVYWALPDLGTVMKGTKDGSQVTPIATGQNMPTRVVLDDTTVYWTCAAEAGAIMSAPKDGSSAPQIIAANEPYPGPLAVDGTHVYWGTLQAFKKAPKGGGDSTVITDEPFVRGVVSDDQSIYWLRADNSVARAPKEGGAPVILAYGQVGSSDIALDDTFVYWTRNAVIDGAKVLRLPK